MYNINKNIKKYYQLFLNHFIHSKTYQPPKLLNYKTPFQLLVAVILSAQCTDQRINKITPPLFRAFPTPHHFANAQPHQIFPYIKTVSYPNNKANYLLNMSTQLIDKFNGKIPDNVHDLQKLAGVGRKTAHVLLSTLYGKSLIAVDTHVFRVAKRLGLVSNQARTPLAVEKELSTYIPEPYRPLVNHWFIAHGRNICKAAKPACHQCPFSRWCAFYKQKRHCKINTILTLEKKTP